MAHAIFRIVDRRGRSELRAHGPPPHLRPTAHSQSDSLSAASSDVQAPIPHLAVANNAPRPEPRRGRAWP